ncbi:MAG: hypothetical protein SCABRO_01499, partial [Candidatus Scalindua brodae]
MWDCVRVIDCIIEGVICKEGHEMDYKGMCYKNEKFIYYAPT